MSHSPNPVTGSKRKRSPEAGDAGSPIIHLQLTNSAAPKDAAVGDGDDPVLPVTVPIAMSVAMQNSALLQQLLDDVTEDDTAAGEGIVLPLGGVPDVATLRRVVTLFEKFSEDFDEHTKRVCKDPFKAASLSHDGASQPCSFTEWELDFFSGIIAEDGCCTSLLRLLQAADYLICGAMIKVVAAYIAAYIYVRSNAATWGRGSFNPLPQTLFPTEEHFADPFAPEHISPHVAAFIVESMVCNVEAPAFAWEGVPELFDHMDIIQRYSKIFPSFIEAAPHAPMLWKEYGLEVDLSALRQPLRLQVIAARSSFDPQAMVSIVTSKDVSSEEDSKLSELFSEHCQFLRGVKNVTVKVSSHMKRERERFIATALSMLWKVEELSITAHLRLGGEDGECDVPVSDLISTLPALEKLSLTNIVLRDRLENIINVKELVMTNALVREPASQDPRWVHMYVEDDIVDGFVPERLPRNVASLTITVNIAVLAKYVPTVLAAAPMRTALENCKSLEKVNVHTNYPALAAAMEGFEMEKVKIHEIL